MALETASPVQSARPNLSAYLAQQVLALIRDRNLGPGDRLPSAKALADQFQVATPTIREALRRLQATGVVDIRHGSGIYVRRERERLMLSNPGYGALEHHTVLQLLDARILIEPHLAELAALHGGDDYVIVICGGSGGPGWIPIGTCTEGAGVTVDGVPVEPQGWEHAL